MDSFSQRAARLIERAGGGDTKMFEAWRPEQGEHPNPLVAVVTGYSETENEYGTQKILNVRDEDGKDWAVWLIHHALRETIGESQPQVGQMVYLKYQGKKQSKKSPDRQFHAYNVQVESLDEATFEPVPVQKHDDEDIPF